LRHHRSSHRAASRARIRFRHNSAALGCVAWANSEHLRGPDTVFGSRLAVCGIFYAQQVEITQVDVNCASPGDRVCLSAQRESDTGATDHHAEIAKSSNDTAQSSGPSTADSDLTGLSCVWIGLRNPFLQTFGVPLKGVSDSLAVGLQQPQILSLTSRRHPHVHRR